MNVKMEKLERDRIAQEEEYKGFDDFENIQYNENFGNYINIVSIKYELTYDDYSVLKVVINLSEV